MPTGIALTAIDDEHDDVAGPATEPARVGAEQPEQERRGEHAEVLGGDGEPVAEAAGQRGVRRAGSRDRWVEDRQGAAGEGEAEHRGAAERAVRVDWRGGIRGGGRGGRGGEGGKRGEEEEGRGEEREGGRGGEKEEGRKGKNHAGVVRVVIGSAGGVAGPVAGARLVDRAVVVSAKPRRSARIAAGAGWRAGGGGGAGWEGFDAELGQSLAHVGLAEVVAVAPPWNSHGAVGRVLECRVRVASGSGSSSGSRPIGEEHLTVASWTSSLVSRTRWLMRWENSDDEQPGDAVCGDRAARR